MDGRPKLCYPVFLSFSKNVLIRLALVPTSLRPTRETERTSIRLPWPAAAMRMTMSSLNPNQKVVSVASIRPSPGFELTIVHPMSRAVRRACSKAWGGEQGKHCRSQVRVGGFLLCGDLRSPVIGRVGRILPEGKDGDKNRRVLRVGRDVVNRRHGLGRAPP